MSQWPCGNQRGFFLFFSPFLHFGRAPNFSSPEDHLGLGIAEACRWSRKKTEEGKKPLKKEAGAGRVIVWDVRSCQ
jgi:hypothetical protein